MGKPHILIIGAGSAGLCAAHYATANNQFNCTLFEQSGTIGGTWVYTDSTQKDDYGLPVHSSMYKLLKTNLPKEVMGFLDFPFPEAEESFIHHSHVLQYLKHYTEKKGLLKYIKFHKMVNKVEPILRNGMTSWKVLVKDVPTGKIDEHMFDAVMVCNGHYSDPKIPLIPGIEKFNGLILHSHHYRMNKPFKGKSVVVWGASASGLDISLEISNVAKQVFICSRLPHKVSFAFPENMKHCANVVSAFDNGFVLEDGTSFEVDAFLYCTGYCYTFPFLSEDCGIQVKENHVVPLYKHLINIEHPSMCLVGLPFIVLPFITFDYQVQFFLKTLDKSITLPSKEEMIMDSERDLQKRLDLGMPARYAHKMDSLQWEYFDELADCAKINRLPLVIRKIYDDVKISRKCEITRYKNYKYEILDRENFKKSMLLS